MWVWHIQFEGNKIEAMWIEIKIERENDDEDGHIWNK